MTATAQHQSADFAELLKQKSPPLAPTQTLNIDRESFISMWHDWKYLGGGSQCSQCQIERKLTLIDTDVLIDAARGIAEAKDYLKDLAANDIPAISVVTQMELLVGCRNKTELRELDGFLNQFQTIPLDAAIGDKPIELPRL